MIAAFDEAVADAGIDRRYPTYPGAKHACAKPRATAKGQPLNLRFAFSAESARGLDASRSASAWRAGPR